MCVLGRYVVVTVACIMFVVVLRHRVECIYYPCTHTHTQKKIVVVIRGCCCTKQEVCYNYAWKMKNLQVSFTYKIALKME
jgi:3-deoxy-D-arabino-heptulosonate 7-phosphate (DAHP) synthase